MSLCATHFGNTLDARFTSPFRKGNIARIDIALINVERLQRCENACNLCPSFTENFRSFVLPLFKNVFAEVRNVYPAERLQIPVAMAS